MRTLADMGPAKLWDAEQDCVREAADAMLFCGDVDDDPEARLALADVAQLVERLVESGRWTGERAGILFLDVCGCGPEPSVDLALPRAA
jgi:hypothetical protein